MLFLIVKIKLFFVQLAGVAEVAPFKMLQINAALFIMHLNK